MSAYWAPTKERSSNFGSYNEASSALSLIGQAKMARWWVRWGRWHGWVGVGPSLSEAAHLASG